MVALSPPDRLSKKSLAADKSVLIKKYELCSSDPKKCGQFESVDIDITNEIAPGLKARQSIGCRKIKLMCCVSMEKARPWFNQRRMRPRLV